MVETIQYNTTQHNTVDEEERRRKLFS